MAVAWVTWANFKIFDPKEKTKRAMCFKFGTEMEDGPRLHRQRAVFASLWKFFFIALVYAGHAVFVIRLRGFKDWSLSCAKPCVNCLLEHHLFNTWCWCTCNSADMRFFLHYVIAFVCCVICRHLNVICDWHIFHSLRRVLMLEHII